MVDLDDSMCSIQKEVEELWLIWDQNNTEMIQLEQKLMKVEAELSTKQKEVDMITSRWDSYEGRFELQTIKYDEKDRV